MTAPVRIGIIDSGVSGPPAAAVAAWRCLVGGERLEDDLGHGTTICQLILEALPDARLVVAKVFADRPTTRTETVAEAVDWLTGQDVAIINMSFGLSADRPVLADACARAAREGIALVASAPAQGPQCYPAGYASTIAVTGDARCDRGVVSHLAGNALFGTWCASPERDPSAAISGASIAAAHFTGLAAAWLRDHRPAGAVGLIAHFTEQASFHGPERRRAEVKP